MNAITVPENQAVQARRQVLASLGLIEAEPTLVELIHRLRQLHEVAAIIETWAPAPDGARSAIGVRREADALLRNVKEARP